MHKVSLTFTVENSIYLNEFSYYGIEHFVLGLEEFVHDIVADFVLSVEFSGGLIFFFFQPLNLQI